MATETNEKERPFGIGPFRPKFMQPIATIKGFVIFVATYSVFTGMFGTYSISQITTIEKHFGMTSEQSGFLFTIQDIGFFVLSPFMGIFFCRLHRPRVLAVCCIAQVLSNLCFVIPFIIHMVELNQGEKVVETYLNETNIEGLCRMTNVVNKTCNAEAERSGVSDDWAYGLLAFGMFLNGAGATGLWTVGIAYIDDNAGHIDSPKYLGSLLCIRFLAPIFGSLLGSGVGKLHVHLEGSSSTHWVGAWWLGYIVNAVVLVSCVVPLSMFPRSLPRKKSDEQIEMSEVDESKNQLETEEEPMEIEEGENEQEVFEVKDLYRALIRIFTNVPFVILCLGLTVDIAGVVAYYSFLPKYLEDQFYVTTSASNLIMGICVPLADAVGMAFSGWFMSNVRLALSRLFLVATIFETLVYLVSGALIFLTCPTVEMRGISTGAIVEECNARCQCDMNRYFPVCGSDGITYYSPCFAGCTTLEGSTYQNCACLPTPVNVTSVRSAAMAAISSSAEIGLCTDQCDTNLIIYSLVLFVTNVLSSSMTMVFLMFILRIVAKKDKSLGQATINVFAALGSMPAATLFGRLIDSFCVLLYPSTSGCNSESGACLRYDRDQFRYKYHGSSFALRIIGCLSYFIVWYGVRNRKFAGDDERKKQKKKGCHCDMKGSVEE